jgi:hypothetical protein
MKKKNRVPYNTTIDVDIIKKLKILAAMQERRQNDLFEESMKDVLEKYGVKSKNINLTARKHKKKQS